MSGSVTPTALADGGPETRRALALRRKAANRTRRRLGMEVRPEVTPGNCDGCNGWGLVGRAGVRCGRCNGSGEKRNAA